MNQSELEICQLLNRVAELESQLEKIKKEQADLVEQVITIKKYGLSERLHQYLEKTERAQKLSRLIVDTAGEDDSRSFTDRLRSEEQVQLQETLGDLKPEQPVDNRLEAERYSRQLDDQLNDIEGKLNSKLDDINWDNIFEYRAINNGIVIQKYIAFDEETITVPPHINGIPVVRIGNSAFENCKNTSSIFLPDSIKTIGEHAFSSSGITTMKLPKQLTKIESSAFYSCPLTEVFIPDGVVLEPSAFYGCYKLINISLPRTLKSIDKQVFRSCISLQKIDVPVGVTVIEVEAFSFCRSLQKIDIPVGVTVIGLGAFNDCESLQNVRIPDTVSRIGYSSFSNCVLYCNTGSEALKYARKHGIKVDRYENYPEGK